MHRIRGFDKQIPKKKRHFSSFEQMLEYLLNTNEDIVLHAFIKKSELNTELNKSKKQQRFIWRKVNQSDLSKSKYISMLQYSIGVIRDNKIYKR